jgi:hypothetical protein
MPIVIPMTKMATPVKTAGIIIAAEACDIAIVAKRDP